MRNKIPLHCLTLLWIERRERWKMGYLNPPSNENEKKNAEAIEYYLNYIRSIAAVAARSMHSCFSPLFMFLLLLSRVECGFAAVLELQRQGRPRRKGSFLGFYLLFFLYSNPHPSQRPRVLGPVPLHVLDIQTKKNSV